MTVTVRTSVESARGCGYRKAGGIYLVAGGLAEDCPRLPLPVETCPTCKGGVKPSRGWRWLDGGHEAHGTPEHNARCPLGWDQVIGDAGLVWIGGRFYPTTESFTAEAARMARVARIDHERRARQSRRIARRAARRAA